MRDMLGYVDFDGGFKVIEGVKSLIENACMVSTKSRVLYGSGATHEVEDYIADRGRE